MYIILFKQDDIEMYYEEPSFFINTLSENVWTEKLEDACGFESEELPYKILAGIEENSAGTDSQKNAERMSKWHIIWIDSRKRLQVTARHKKKGGKPPFIF